MEGDRDRARRIVGARLHDNTHSESPPPAPAAAVSGHNINITLSNIGTLVLENATLADIEPK